jgi:hypothetical protein
LALVALVVLLQLALSMLELVEIQYSAPSHLTVAVAVAMIQQMARQVVLGAAQVIQKQVALEIPQVHHQPKEVLEAMAHQLREHLIILAVVAVGLLLLVQMPQPPWLVTVEMVQHQASAVHLLLMPVVAAVVHIKVELVAQAELAVVEMVEQ